MERCEGTYNGNNTEGQVIELDQLCKGDRVSVQTRRSSYQFSVSDASRRRGTLTGGALGNQILEAFLGGTISKDRTDSDSSELKTGARAIFFIDLRYKAQRLVTSPITDIAIVKGDLAWKPLPDPSNNRDTRFG